MGSAAFARACVCVWGDLLDQYTEPKYYLKSDASTIPRKWLSAVQSVRFRVL